jgi:hypothetical protein
MSSQDGGGSFSLALSDANGLTDLTGVVSVPKTSNWNTYKVVHGRLNRELEAGRHIIRFIVNKSGFNFDKIVFNRIDVDETIQLALSADPVPVTVNTNTTLSATASIEGGSIANVRFYADNMLLKTVSATPFETVYKPTAKGTIIITAEATTQDGKVSPVATISLKVNPKRTPHKGVISLPGIIEAENFDRGEEGFTYHDSDNKNEGTTAYRSDSEGVDIVTGNGGYAIGYTAVGEWLEYTVNVTQPGKYAYEATVSSGTTGSRFAVGLVQDGKVAKTLFNVSVPQTGSNSWDTYRVMKGNISTKLEAGEQILRLTINGANCNIDKIELKCTTPDGIETVDADHLQSDAAVYNLSGQQVSPGYRGIVIRNGRKVFRR